MAQTLVTISESKVVLLTPERYASFWPEISTQLDRIPQFWSPWWTKEFLRTAQYHNMQIWCAGSGDEVHLFVYSQILSYPAMNLFQIVLILGNNLDKHLPTLEALFEKVAHDADCQQFEVIGRSGWGRKLPHCQPIATVYRREIPQFGVH